MTELIESTWEGADSALIPNHRIKVQIRCRNCGESFVLRGTKDFKGNIDTGFKRCLCDNDKDFVIETLT